MGGRAGAAIGRRLLGSIGAAYCVLACGSSAPPYVVTQPPPAAAPARCAGAAVALCAGAAAGDVTPLPGVPIFGYSTDGQKRAAGHRTRLRARALVLEDRRGERLAIVQIDLGAVSAVLHRKVAEKLADRGLGPDRILLAATHTHGGPGGFFGERFYNTWGAGAAGFDEAVVDWLSSAIATTVIRASEALRPARMGVTQIAVEGVSRNRSPAAWSRNSKYECGCGESREQVDRMLTLLRVDPLEAVDGASARPIAAFAIFAIHSNVIPYDEPLLHGDLHGRAARALAARIRAAYPAADEVVVALLNGAEGDVIAKWAGPADRTHERVEQLAAVIADRAAEAFRSLDPEDRRHADVTLARGYREVPVPGALTSGGRLCEKAIIGLPTILGAFDTPSGLEKIFELGVGHEGDPEGCRTYKVKVFGKIQDWVLAPQHFPRRAPFQVLRIDPLVALATVPGEPTRELGRGIVEDLRRVPGIAEGASRKPLPVVVVGLANDYIGYWTTSEEYRAQHYEGGSTFYGPLQGVFAREQLVATAEQIGAAHPPALRPERSFDPGGRKSFWSDAPCGASGWRFVTPPARTAGVWQVGYVGPPASRRCNPPPRLWIECDGRPLAAEDGLPEDDDSLRLHARLATGGDGWLATWQPGPNVRGRCRFVLARPDGLEPVRSEELEP